MTQSLYLAKRTQPVPGIGLINGVFAVVVQLADSTSAANVKIAALTACNALYPTDASQPSEPAVFPTGYFDSVETLGSAITPGTPLAANGDAYVLSTRAGVEFYDA